MPNDDSRKNPTERLSRSGVPRKEQRPTATGPAWPPRFPMICTGLLCHFVWRFVSPKRYLAETPVLVSQHPCCSRLLSLCVIDLVDVIVQLCEILDLDLDLDLMWAADRGAFGI
jgi:hypothetical protein